MRVSLRTQCRPALLGMILFSLAGGSAWATCGKAGSLSEILPGCFADGPTLSSSNSHSGHFEAEPEALATMRAVNTAMAAQFSTYPLGSSSGGFTYVFDSSAGTYRRSTDSFGPSFAERSLTLGKHKWNVGLGFVHSNFDSIDGIDLRHGDLGVNLVHEEEGQPGPLDPNYQGDLIRSDVSMGLKLDTALFFANFGISERFDVGLVVPVVRSEVDVRVHMTIDPIATQSGTHVFPDGTLRKSTEESGTETGIGDVIVRGKYNFLRKTDAGLAVAVDLRLPTGDEEDFLGSGATQTKVYLIASGKLGSFWPHVNAGYTFSSGGSDETGDPSDEINYSAGFDVALHPRLTFATDIIGRTLRDAQRLKQSTQPYPYATTSGVSSVAYRPSLEVTTDDASLAVASVGFKYNPTSNLLFSAGALVSLTRDTGLQDDTAAVFGVDYSF